MVATHSVVWFLLQGQRGRLDICCYLVTIIFTICFSRPWFSTLFLVLILWLLMFWILLYPQPSPVDFLDHEILSNYWMNRWDFTSLIWFWVYLTSFFPKQNMNLWLFRLQARQLPTEPLNPKPSWSLDCLLLIGLQSWFLSRWTLVHGNRSLTCDRKE